SALVSNSFGAVTSAPASLIVNDPIITTQPIGLTVISGGAANFSVAAFGTTPLNYQWRKDGSNIVGATLTALSLTNIQTSNAGSYTVVVQNNIRSVASAIAQLTVITVAPDSLNPGANGDVNIMLPLSDGKILVGGYFSTLGGSARPGLGRLNAEGTLDTSFAP